MGQTSNLAINPTLTPSCPLQPAYHDWCPWALSSPPIVMAAPVAAPSKSFADVAGCRQEPSPTPSRWAIPATARWPTWPESSRERRWHPAAPCAPQGRAQAMTDLVGGQIDLHMSSVPRCWARCATVSCAPSPDLGQALGSTARHPTLESEVTRFESVTGFGSLALPGRHRAAANKAINQARCSNPTWPRSPPRGWRDRWHAREVPDQLRAELPRWAKTVKASGATLTESVIS